MFDGDLMVPISVRLEKRGFSKFLSIANPIVWFVLCIVTTFRLIEFGEMYLRQVSRIGSGDFSEFPLAVVIFFVLCSICNYMVVIGNIGSLREIYSELSSDAKRFNLKFKENKNTLIKDSIVYGIFLFIILCFSMSGAVLLSIGVISTGIICLVACVLITICVMPLTAKIGKQKVELRKDTETVYNELYNCEKYQEYLYRDFEMKLRTNNYESNC